MSALALALVVPAFALGLLLAACDMPLTSLEREASSGPHPNLNLTKYQTPADQCLDHKLTLLARIDHQAPDAESVAALVKFCSEQYPRLSQRERGES